MSECSNATGFGEIGVGAGSAHALYFVQSTFASTAVVPTLSTVSHTSGARRRCGQWTVSPPNCTRAWLSAVALAANSAGCRSTMNCTPDGSGEAMIFGATSCLVRHTPTAVQPAGGCSPTATSSSICGSGTPSSASTDRRSRSYRRIGVSAKQYS